jgi:hypothetical protein
MPANRRMVRLFIAAIALTATLGAFVLAAGLSRGERSAQCHESEPFKPAPAPVNHQCCASGHNWALASAALSFHLATAATFEDFSSDSGLIGSDGLGLTPRLVIPSADPPGATCLRI